MEAKRTEKSKAMESSKALKKAVHDRALAAVCEEHGLPSCLSPFLKFNKCSIVLTAKDPEAVMEMCRHIISHQRDFLSPLASPVEASTQ
jgi:hypothetical protein